MCNILNLLVLVLYAGRQLEIPCKHATTSIISNILNVFNLYNMKLKISCTLKRTFKEFNRMIDWFISLCLTLFLLQRSVKLIYLKCFKQNRHISLDLMYSTLLKFRITMVTKDPLPKPYIAYLFLFIYKFLYIICIYTMH